MRFINKKFYLIFVLTLVFSFLAVSEIYASATDNVSGFAWSENIGWISFNSKNCDVNGDGKSEGTPAGCPVSGTPMANYGVNINPSTSMFSGYAWSENIGWIDFAPAGPYPASPNYSACLDMPGNGQACNGVGNYKTAGWARALSYDASWDGWLKLRGSNYDVDLGKQTGQFSGYAWGSDIIGWINFKGSNYGVTTTFALNQPPNKPEPSGEDNGIVWNNCSTQEKSIPTFSWTYFDPESDLQSAYEIEVDDDSSFNAPKFNHLVNLAATSYALNLLQDDDILDPGGYWAPVLDWNVQYFWRVRVKDNQGNWSAWSSSNNFRTPAHAYPWVDFFWAPVRPSQNETVSFDPDASVVYDGSSIDAYLWSVSQGTGSFVDSTNADSHYPHIQFSTLSNKINLQITDDDDFSCSKEKDVTAQLPLPEYKEIPPIIWFRKILAGLAFLF